MANENENNGSNPFEGANAPEGEAPEGAAEGEAPEVDRYGNLQSEFNRKFGSLKEQTQAIARQIEALTGAITSRNAPQAPQGPSPEELQQLQYNDPAAFARAVADNAKREATAAVREVTSKEQEKTVALNTLYRDYPQLGDTSSDLTSRALEIFRASGEDSARAMRLAVREAAAELGVLPVGKQPPKNNQRNDEFVGGPTSSNAPRRRADAPVQLDPKTIDFAREVGLNVDDPAVLKRMQGFSKRKWNRYQ